LDDTIDGVDANAVSLTQLGLTVASHTTGLAASALAVDAIELDIIATDANVLSSANKISTLELTVDDPTTGVSATASALAQTNLDVSAVDGRVTTSATDISGLETTVSDPTTGLVTRVGVTEGYGARIDTVDGQIVDLGAEYFVKLDVNNNVSGFGLVNNGSSSEFKILANKFTIVDPAAPTNASATPFVVSGGVTYMQNVVVGNTVIANDAITTDKINVTNLSAISANLGTVTAGTMKTASSGYRVEVSDAGDFPIWYGTGAKTANNGLFYVKKDGSVFINAVVNAQAGSSIQSLDVQCSISNTLIYQNAPATGQTLANNLLYTYTNGSGNYTYKWTKQGQLTSASQTISSTTVQKPVFTTSAVARNDQSITSWEVKVTDTTTGGTFRETVFVRFINVGATQ
jgi:YD repeat-containing protein